MEYFPDRWAIVDFSKREGKPCYSVLAGWAGSYLYGASWKRSSPIVKVEKREDYYALTTETGSRYIVSDSSVGFTGMTASLAHGMSGTGEVEVFGDAEDVAIILNKLENENE